MQSITIAILALMVGFLSWELSKTKEDLDHLYYIVVTMINTTQETIDFGVSTILIEKEEQGDEDGE